MQHAMDLHELEEDPNTDFQGATLQIQNDSCPISPSGQECETDAMARIALSSTSNTPSSSDGRPNTYGNSEAITLKPAVSSGVDVISPIASIPSKIASTFRRSSARGAITDVACQNALLAEDEAKDYFTYRDGLVETAIKECIRDLIVLEQDGEVLSSWLLTEISLWDHEKERLVILATNTVTTVKYDFIALKQLEYRKVPIALIDTLVLGDLVYPTSSLVPRVNGLASGVVTVLKGCLLRPLQERWARSNNNKEFCPSTFDFGSFEPRSRGVRGVRIMWNRGEPLPFSKKWNPFNNEVPFTTYTSHPLLWHKESSVAEGNKMYDIVDFSARLASAVERAQSATQRPAESRDIVCTVRHSPIILQNYVGLTSLIHNRNSLGFFKVRGRFSF